MCRRRDQSHCASLLELWGVGWGQAGSGSNPSDPKPQQPNLERREGCSLQFPALCTASRGSLMSQQTATARISLPQNLQSTKEVRKISVLVLPREMWVTSNQVGEDICHRKAEEGNSVFFTGNPGSVCWCSFMLQSRQCLAEMFQEIAKSKMETSKASILSRFYWNVHFSSLFSHWSVMISDRALWMGRRKS